MPLSIKRFFPIETAIAWSCLLLVCAGCSRSETAKEHVDAARASKTNEASLKHAETSRQVSVQGLNGVILSDCETINHAGLDRDSIIDKFSFEFPSVIVNEAEIEKLRLDNKQIDMLTEYAACMAGNSGYDPLIAESSLALFSSPKFSKRAIQSLDQQARESQGAHGEQAREFAEQIKGYLESTEQQ